MIVKRWMEFLAKNVRKREDINRWVKVITLPESLRCPLDLTINANFEVLSHFLGKRYGFDNIGAWSWLSVCVWTSSKPPTHAHKNHSSHLWRKKNKYRHSAKDMFNRMDLKSFHKWFIREIRTWVRFLTGVYENKREDERRPNKSIKELKAENKELAELKIVCCWRCQNEEIKRLKRERARTWAWMIVKQEMAWNRLVWKVWKSYLKKTLIEV